MSSRLYFTDGTSLRVKGSPENMERQLNSALPRGFVPVEPVDGTSVERVAVNHVVKITD